VHVTRGNRSCGDSTRPPKVNGRQCVTHLAGGITAWGGVTEAELAITVVSPTLDTRVVEHDTCVCATRRQRHCRATRTKIDWQQCIAHRGTRATEVVFCAASQSTFAALAKTLHRCIIEQHARVQCTCRHGAHRATRSKTHRNECVAHFGGRIAEGDHATRANLPG
jgi:hypothetical protein